jgi:hypothetical protein
MSAVFWHARRRAGVDIDHTTWRVLLCRQARCRWPIGERPHEIVGTGMRSYDPVFASYVGAAGEIDDGGVPGGPLIHAGYRGADVASWKLVQACGWKSRPGKYRSAR